MEYVLTDRACCKVLEEVFEILPSLEVVVFASRDHNTLEEVRQNDEVIR